VAVLDEAFAAIATARANTEQNLRNAHELAEEATESAFPPDIQSGAGARTLVELCDLIVDCEHKTAPTQDEGIPSIRTPNVGRGRLVIDGVRRVSEETYKEWTRRVEPKPGDLILAREAPAGNVAVIPDGLRVCLGQRTVLLRPNRSVFEPAYLAHLLLRRESQRRMLAHSRGATVQHVNVKDIRAFKVVSIPPLDAQRAIVQKVDEATESVEKLETCLRRKLTALDTLKQSLLHEAFAGAL
jgi:type I restriction enzyme S subunit